MTGKLCDGSLLDSDVGNVLLLLPAFSTLSDHICSSLLSTGSMDDTTALVVSTKHSADERLQSLRSHGDGDLPARLGFVQLGEHPRNGADESAVAMEQDGCAIRLESVPNPGNLTRVGIGVTTIIKEWADADGQFVFCLDSLTTLLQYVEAKTLYQFLHVLTRQVRAEGGMAHYHLNPDACDSKTVSQLLSLFDAVIESDGSGEWRLRTR